MLTWLESIDEAATRFVAAEQSKRAIPADPCPGPPYRVLVVDDDESTCRLLRDILENYSDIAVVGQAGDGSEAISLAARHQPDVVLMDVGLPSLDGIEATYRIKKACPRTVVICLTGHFSPPIYNAMRTAGATLHVCKNQILGIHETIMCALGRWTE
jgi:DNA-binding NarL/FixJ family response regulator